jgi:undecaprenyl-diphosphatase
MPVTPKLSRHKHWIEFLIRRFDRRGPYGLFFTFGLGVIAAAMWAFGGVLQDVVAGEEIALFDKPLVSFIAEHRVSWLTTAMRGATLLGTAWFIVSLVICAGFLLGVRARSWRPFLFLGSAAGGAGLLDFIAKVVIGRPRPPAVWMVGPVTGFSFPSGHAAEAAVYGMLAYLVARTCPTCRTKLLAWTIAAAASFAIGVSRVYLGVHWPTDVMGGWALAALWLAVLLTGAHAIEVGRSPLPSKKGSQGFR